MSLGDRLKERRIMLNLSRKKLSEITYITPQALANYENGISTPKFEILVSLFQALECDANYLYQDYLPSNLQTDFNITKNEQDLIEKYRQLNDHGKHVAKLIIDQEYARMLEGLMRKKRVCFPCLLPTLHNSGLSILMAASQRKSVSCLTISQARPTTASEFRIRTFWNLFFTPMIFLP